MTDASIFVSCRSHLRMLALEVKQNIELLQCPPMTQSGHDVQSELSFRKKFGTSRLPFRFPLSVDQRRFRRKYMRTFLIALTALGAIAVALPAVTANAQDRTVIVRKDGHHDRGLHRGWTRGHHYGWRNHNAKVVVIKKKHHHYD
jgi:hypothetical protein